MRNPDRWNGRRETIAAFDCPHGEVRVDLMVSDQPILVPSVGWIHIDEAESIVAEAPTIAAAVKWYKKMNPDFATNELPTERDGH